MTLRPPHNVCGPCNFSMSWNIYHYRSQISGRNSTAFKNNSPQNQGHSMLILLQLRILRVPKVFWPMVSQIQRRHASTLAHLNVTVQDTILRDNLRKSSLIVWVRVIALVNSDAPTSCRIRHNSQLLHRSHDKHRACTSMHSCMHAIPACAVPTPCCA